MLQSWLCVALSCPCTSALRETGTPCELEKLLMRSAPNRARPPPSPCSCPAGSVLLLRELDRQARQQGGAVYMLNGNHESLNVAGDFR